jgi:hypothetical protein
MNSYLNPVNNTESMAGIRAALLADARKRYEEDQEVRRVLPDVCITID